MLEDHFIVPDAAKTLRSCVLGDHLNQFCSVLIHLGYKPSTIRHKLWELSGLARWMEDELLAVVELDEQRVDDFLDLRRRSGRTCRGFRSTALLLIEQLRSAGVVAAPEPVCDVSPAAETLKRYEDSEILTPLYRLRKLPGRHRRGRAEGSV